MSVKISQCMIVKNEEHNIARALTWGKGVVCEQIVVDTGSTDKTVEIAESMGAKVLHFEWRDDFAAAKNYAIENATGDWIAFLDADEFMLEEDAAKIIPYLESISKSKKKKDIKAVFCPLMNINDKGMKTGVYPLIRIFKNSGDVRYIGRVHENLSIDIGSTATTEEFKIIHTGYGKTALSETEKIERNLRILREDVKEYPDDMNLKAYLAETLMAGYYAGILCSFDAAEAVLLYKQVIESGSYIDPNLKKNAYAGVLSEYADKTETDVYYEEIADKALSEFPDDTRIMCLYAMVQNKKGNYQLAFEVLKNCEIVLNNDLSANTGTTIRSVSLYASQLAHAAQGLNDVKALVKSTVLILMLNKENIEALKACIASFMSGSFSVEQTLNILSDIYDLKDKRDLLLIAKAAKDVGAIGLAKVVLSMDN